VVPWRTPGIKGKSTGGVKGKSTRGVTDTSVGVTDTPGEDSSGTDPLVLAVEDASSGIRQENTPRIGAANRMEAVDAVDADGLGLA